MLWALFERVGFLERAAIRGRYLTENAEWHRREDEQDGERTWLSVRVADNADLSCRAFREMAVDQAIQKAGFK